MSSVKLPLIPEVSMQLLDTLNKDDVHASEITALVQHDPSIAATVLKHANSSRYGLATRVANIDDAVRLLGFNNVRMIALSAGIATSYPIANGLNKDSFWKSSFITAEFASAIAIKLKRDRHIPWMAGFLLRVGELMIAQFDIEAIKVIEALPLLPGQRWAREVTLVGATEGQLVAKLADSWNFPEALVNTLKTAADPLSEEWAFFEEAAIVHIASLMSDMRMLEVTDSDVMLSHLPTDILAEIGLEIDFYKTLYASAIHA